MFLFLPLALPICVYIFHFFIVEKKIQHNELVTEEQKRNRLRMSEDLKRKKERGTKVSIMSTLLICSEICQWFQKQFEKTLSLKLVAFRMVGI